MTPDLFEDGQCEVSVVRAGERERCMLTWRFHKDRSRSISLSGPFGTLEGAGDDLFEALNVIRRSLEGQGWFIAVQGARRNTWASGMLRDMIGARHVYVLEPGRDIRTREDWVDIFAEAEPDQLATVEEQRQYYREWQESARREWIPPSSAAT
ncbi:hypothetical protein I6A84_31125 [Frankia sp. CNm7]|uniref:Uncharacterized protein n=1 Tax=Frankia nepalensis TaxID=1836974 RepID=A0A937RMA5_9ACTN|nr:hypothetical protein [Frankia nepalensis]MBL7500249.1 hypothetical protein [Frankia nepalensis]MBL7513525.1 hypothetical protein [Frankia nepalensis]MBL7522418.1 hypothetical protein [Frankia nepalensis]MBL7628988.1 hypothetical protein [Frankia nepalensis]